MTDKKWNKEEYEKVREVQKSHEEYQKEFSIEMQTRLYEECKDPIQKERYLKGLDILKRNN
jgi:hypothetical protein